MANKRITALNELLTAGNADVLAIVDGLAMPIETKKITVQNLVKNDSDVLANTAHRSSDGTDHSDVVLNNAHRVSDGKDHSDVVLNNAHRVSAGTDHSDVVLNNGHRVSTGNPHSATTANIPEVTNLYYTDARVKAVSSSLVSRSQIVGTTLNPFRLDAAFILLNQMTYTFTPASASNIIVVKFSGEFEGVGKEETVSVAIFIDGIQQANTVRSCTDKLGRPQSISLEKQFLLPAVSQTIEIRWKTSVSDFGATAVDNDRILIVEEWEQ